MYEFGSIVLVPFPFTDLSSSKVQPALIVSRSDHPGDDVIVCFITSKANNSYLHKLILDASNTTGLKIRSAVRFDKIATLSKDVILGELGKVEASELNKHSKLFSEVFGFAA